MPKYIHPVQRISASDSLFSGTVRITGGPNITVGSDASGVSISGAAGGNYSAGISTMGNTSGDTGLASNRLVLVGTNNITLSGSTNAGSMTVSISGGAGGGGGVNISASNTLYTSGTVTFTGARGIEIATNANQNVIVQNNYDSLWHAYPWQPGQFVGISNGTLFIHNMDLSRPLTASAVHLPLSVSPQTNSTAGINISFGIYTRSNATRIDSVTSGSTSYSWSSSSNSSTNWGGYSGLRVFTIPITINATPGNYWYVIGVRSSNAGSISFVCRDIAPTRLDFAGSNSATSGSADPFVGMYGTSSTALRDTIGAGDINTDGLQITRKWVILTNL